MAKRDKEYESRMQGMLYALNVSKEHGVDYLEKEIKKRGVIKSPLAYTDKQIDEFWKQLSENLYATMTCVTGMVLHNTFGFGKQRLHKFREEFLNATNKTIDLDWLGERYVRLEDYAIELNKRYNLGIDVARIAACQDLADEADARYRKLNTDIALRELENNGFRDAADFLRSKISDIGRIEHGEINRMDTRRTQSNPENGFAE